MTTTWRAGEFGVRPVRIANCSGFHGDPAMEMYNQATMGEVDFITGDYLAEVNMAKNAEAYAQGQHPGYEPSALDGLDMTLEVLDKKRIKVAINGGALNPRGLAEKVAGLAKERGLSLSVAHVTGDDILPLVRKQLQEPASAALPHLDSANAGATTPKEVSDLFRHQADEVVSANAYMGARGIVTAFRNGADIVIAGRVSDASPVIAAAWYWWSWADDDYDRLAGALVAGHLIECSAYVTGGNFAGFDQPKYGGLDRFVHPGFPVSEVDQDGSCVITKHAGTGGIVDMDTVRCQLLYELQGNIYLHSDAKAVLDGVRVVQLAQDRVRVSGIVGLPPPPTTKVAVFYKGGYESQVLLNTAGYAWEAKCDLFEKHVRRRIGEATLARFDLLEFQRIGVPALDPPSQNSSTMYIRIVSQAKDEATVWSVARAVGNISLRHFHGFHSSSDMRTAIPRPYIAYYPALWEQCALKETVTFVSGPSGEPSTLTVDAGHPPAFEQLLTRESYDAASSTSFDGPVTLVKLGDVALARSGDKGSNLNVGVFVQTDKQWQWLRAYLSRDRMRQLLGDDAQDSFGIERVEFPHIFAVHFVVYGILGRGVSSSTRLDSFGKGFADYLRDKTVEVPVELLSDGGARL